MLTFLIIISILGGVFFTSELFMDPMNDSKQYLLLITSIILLIICFTSKNGLCKLNRSLQSHGLFIGILVICFLSSFYGLLQYLGVITSNHDSFLVTGSFENPAGYAAVQSCMFPFVFVNCFDEDRGKVERLISSFISVFCIITIVLSGSRTGTLATCSAIGLFFAFEKKVRSCFLKNKWLWLLLAFMLLILFYLLYQVKPDSANGRWFIWSRSLEIIREHPLLGCGPDGFHKLYMEHQADYFRTHPDSPYVMIADNVRHPFNEYIKLTCQYGIVGLLVAIGVLFFIIRKLLKCPERTKKLGLSFIASVFVLCQFSYPFNYHVVWLFSFIAVAPAFINQESIHIIPRLFRYVIIPFLIVLLFFSVRRMYYDMKLKEVTMRTLEGKARRMVPNFEDVDRIMGNDPLFKYNYAVLLNNIGRYEESLTQISMCEEKWNEYSTQILLANIYKKMGQHENAIQAYERAHYMVPCRFEPLYGQFMIYGELGDTTQIIRMAYEIIEKPIKVRSDRVGQMIAHANHAIEVYSSD